MRWYGSHGDYNKLSVFGCRAYAHVRQGKLEARAFKCVMLGYQKGVKGYRLWSTEPGNNKVIINRDVIFKEQDMPYLNKETENTQVEVEVSGQDVGEGHEDTPNGVTQPQDDQSAEPHTREPEQPRILREKSKRIRKLPSKYNDYDMLYYALAVAEEIEYHEPSS